MTRLNDQFMHPNPRFAYREAMSRDEGTEVSLEIQFFDTATETHEAHLLAYLNLLDLVTDASEKLVGGVCGTSAPSGAGVPYVQTVRDRALRLAAANPVAKKVMVELGLWSF